MITPSDWILDYRRRLWANALLCSLVVFTVSLCPLKLVAAPQWHVLETPRFTVVSQLSEKETRKWAEEFNQFIDAINRIITVNEKLLPRLTMVIFTSEKDFRPFLPLQPNGKTQELGGYFSRHETWSVIGMLDGEDDSGTRETIFHEGVHWMLSIYPRYIPLCIQEGLADVYSTFKLSKDTAEWGKPVASSVALLQGKNSYRISVDELLHTATTSAAYNEERRMGEFYAQSWLFVHYLLFGKREGARTALDDFLDALGKAGTIEDAFKTAFGVSYEKMDETLQNYIVRGKYSLGMQKVDQGHKLGGQFLPAPKAIVEMSLAKLAYGGGKTEDALRRAENAVQLAPENPACWDSLACLQASEDVAAGGVEAAKKAVSLGSTDGWSYLILALSKARAAIALGGVPSKEAREIADEIEKGLSLRPNLRAAYRFLALNFSEVENFTNDDVMCLRQGLKLYPDETVLFAGMGFIAKKTGDVQKAQKLLARALKDRANLDSENRAFLEGVKYRWTMEEVQEKVRPLGEAGRYQEGLVVVEGYLADESISTPLRANLVLYRDSFQQYIKFNQARQTGKAGHRDEERKLLGEILSSPRAVPQLKLQVSEELKVLEYSESREKLKKKSDTEQSENSIGESEQK